ncbi:MAG: hypothetical protein KJO24_05035, partial [Gammaproteobacteria bacterium]|nr:hypothetical protein [Gammaproteobacteria bacterium]
MGADGPMANAVVELFRLADLLNEPPSAPNLLSASATTDANGLGSGLVLKAADQNGLVPGPGPFLLRISAGASTIDTTTGAAPAIRSVSTVITASAYASRTGSTRFYATPFTTLGIERASGLAGVSPTAAAVVAQMSAASAEVLQAFGFGADTSINVFSTPPIIDANTVSLADQQNVAAYRVAIETFAEVVEQAATALAITTDAVMDAIKADIKGDGLVGNASSPSGIEQGVVDETNMVDTPYLTDKGRLPSADGSTNIEELLDGEIAGVSAPLA